MAKNMLKFGIGQKNTPRKPVIFYNLQTRGRQSFLALLSLL